MLHQRQRPDLPGYGILTTPERDGPAPDEAEQERADETQSIAGNMAAVLQGILGPDYFDDQHFARDFEEIDGGFTFTSCGRLVTVSVTVSE